MNKFTFYKTFILNRQMGKFGNFSLLLPCIGVILGCMTVSLTLAIMEGMEYSIFTQLKNVSYPAALYNISDEEYPKLMETLSDLKIPFEQSREGQIMLLHNGEFRLVELHGIEQINKFKGNALQISSRNENDNGLLIGHSLALKLDISRDDTVLMVLPSKINLFTGVPQQKYFQVNDIFQLKVLDYEQQHIFAPLHNVQYFLPPEFNSFYLPLTLSPEEISDITSIFPSVKYRNWDDNYFSFISAMKMEKYAYSIIGFLIVGIAGFTLLSMMSLAVIQKVPQIGILNAMGAKGNFISNIFIFQAILTASISGIIGISLSYLFIKYDNQFNLIQRIFPESLFFDFPLILKGEYAIAIFAISTLLLLMAAIYPAYKAAKLDPVQAIGFNK
ncbi:MAG: FtsX-like permease family protein [Candidatus Marinimicrobia bacterium]|nr:FtsX-like permease family protein [Candidatus Neomarinimicrobiota bacterium]